MFAAYSRRVDRKVFSRINDWLGQRGDRTDPAELRRFIKTTEGCSIEKFFHVYHYPCVKLNRTSNYYPLKYDFRFPSPFASGYEENDTVHGEAYLSYFLRAPAVVMYSGWLDTATDYTRLAERIALGGRNLWVIDLPYHIRRTPQGTRSGELSLTGDMVRTLGCVRQAVADARVLIAALTELGANNIAFLGFSLGGWMGALLSIIEPRLSEAVLVTPPLRPDEVLLSSPQLTAIRAGVSEDDRRSLFDSMGQLFIPKERKPILDPRRIHLVGAHEDPIGPPHALKELSRRWGCEYITLPGGHVTVYFTPRFWREILKRLNIHK